MTEKFEKKCQKLIKELDFSKQGVDKARRSHYNFFSKNSTDITSELLKEAEKCIDRKWGKEMINLYLGNEILSIQLEKGIFEYSLISVSKQKLLV